MLYLLILQLLLLVLLRRLAPVRYAVHAARADGPPLGAAIRSRWIGAGLARDENGARIRTRGKFVGAVAGESMKAYGLPCGATFIGDRLTQSTRKRLQEGAIVVINAPAAYSPTGYRLRCVNRVRDDGMVEFKADVYERPHTPRPLSQIVVQVTHVVP